MKVKKSIRPLCLIILIITMNIDLFPGLTSSAETLRIGINEFPAALNPVYASTETSQAIMNKVFNGLFYFDEKGKIQKELVEKFHIRNRDNNTKNNTAAKAKNTVEIVIELKKKIFF